jgi:hypothetical protein
MISAATSGHIFGFSMRTRRARRRLVVITYVGLSLVCAAAVGFSRVNPVSSQYAVWAALLVGIFLFGGQGRFGLVKPFLNKPPREGPDPVERLVFSEPVLLSLLPPAALPTGVAEWKNDERELARRDRAHYDAYQPIGLALVLLLLLASWSLHRPSWLGLEAMLTAMYLVALVATMLVFTLPSAIILWSEPDLPVAEIE